MAFQLVHNLLLSCKDGHQLDDLWIARVAAKFARNKTLHSCRDRSINQSGLGVSQCEGAEGANNGILAGQRGFEGLWRIVCLDDFHAGTASSVSPSRAIVYNLCTHGISPLESGLLSTETVKSEAMNSLTTALPRFPLPYEPVSTLHYLYLTRYKEPIGCLGISFMSRIQSSVQKARGRKLKYVHQQ